LKLLNNEQDFSSFQNTEELSCETESTQQEYNPEMYQELMDNVERVLAYEGLISSAYANCKFDQVKQYRKQARDQSSAMDKSERSKLASAIYRANVKNDINAIQNAAFELVNRFKEIRQLAIEVEQGAHWQVDTLKQLV